MSEKKGRKKWPVIVIAVVLVFALVAGVVITGISKASDQSAGGTVEFITKRTIANSITGNGTVEAAVKENQCEDKYFINIILCAV